MKLRVRSQHNFLVGPGGGRVALSQGSIREVEVDQDGNFSTETDDGNFFGMCKLSRGWDVLCIRLGCSGEALVTGSYCDKCVNNGSR